MKRLIIPTLLLALFAEAACAGTYRTANFVVHACCDRHAQEIAQAAEDWRVTLAKAWLGETLPDWSQPCVMTVQIGTHIGAGGSTTFVFSGGEVFNWRMTIQGSRERFFDSVLPHEITHMIFACRFRQSLPRWADEGAAMSVEHPNERAKHYRMLIQFLRSNRGIAFNRMFAMEEYPRDIMPLYAQAATLTDFLLQRSGRQGFVRFLADALPGRRWNAAILQHYGFQSVGVLQQAWLAWVQAGFPTYQGATQ